MKLNNGDGQYLKELGRKIKAVREKRKLYLRDLGEMSGINYGAICEIENGKRDCHILTLKAIAEQLQVSVKDFL